MEGGEKHVPNAANFRDVSGACEISLKHGQIFRSSEVYGCEVLTDYKIKTILDLRRVDKCAMKREKQVHSEYPHRCHPCMRHYEALGKSVPNVYHVDFVPTHVGLYIMSKMPLKICFGGIQLSFCAVLRWKVAKVACKREDPAKVMCPAVANPAVMGFNQLYITLLDKSQESIAKALRLFVSTDNFPILVHCIHGKDRTGMVVMLILLLSGVPVEAVLKDYAQSEISLKESKARNELHMAEYLQQDCVISAGKSNLEAALDHIDKKYGGISKYVAKIGITAEEERCIRYNVLQKTMTSKMIRC